MYKSKHFEMYFPIKTEKEWFDTIIDGWVNSGYFAEESAAVAITSDRIIEQIDKVVEDFGFDVVFGSNNGTNEKMFIQSVAEWNE